MSCREWEERIALDAGGDLAPAEAAELAGHLAACDSCREAAASLRDSLEGLRDAHRETITPAHLAAVRARVLERLARPPLWRRAWILGPAMGAAVTAAVVALVLARWPAVPPPPPVPRLPALARMVAPTPAPRPVASRARRRSRAVAPPAEPVEPLVVRLVTDDPDVVLYWIADRKGD